MSGEVYYGVVGYDGRHESGEEERKEGAGNAIEGLSGKDNLGVAVCSSCTLEASQKVNRPLHMRL